MPKALMPQRPWFAVHGRVWCYRRHISHNWNRGMPCEPENDDAISSAVAAALLGSVGRMLNGWSMLFALVALLIRSMRPVGIFAALACVASLVAAGAQIYFALRCAFDAAVFARLGGEPTHYAQFDRILSAWGIKKADIEVRSIDERVRGATALCRRQAYCLGVQGLLFAVALIAVVGG